jgi:hypothetical protein
MYGILSLANSTLLTADTILLRKKKTLCLIHDSHYPFVEKYVFCCSFGATALPLTVTYIWIVPSKLLPTPKLEDRPLSAVGGCLFNKFAAILHLQPEDAPCCDKGPT